MKHIKTFKSFLNEGGIGYDTIADEVYSKVKQYGSNWETHATKMLKTYDLSKNEFEDILNMLRGEDYFDTGEFE